MATIQWVNRLTVPLLLVYINSAFLGYSALDTTVIESLTIFALPSHTILRMIDPEQGGVAAYFFVVLALAPCALLASCTYKSIYRSSEESAREYENAGIAMLVLWLMLFVPLLLLSLIRL